MNKLLLVLVALLLTQGAQAQYGNYYSVRDADATAVKITVQQTAGNQALIQMDYVEAWCEEAYTLTLRRDGTAASTTATTPVKANGTEPNASFTAYIDSNVGDGTLIDSKDFAAGQTVGIDLTIYSLARGGGTTDNFTVAAIGNCRIFLSVKE